MNRKYYFVAIVALVALIYTTRGSSDFLLENYSFSKEVLDSEGKLLRLTTSSDEKYRIYTPLKEISPQVIAATLEQEDRWFYYHPGVNPVSILRAVLQNLTTQRKLGASTLSMQLARLRYGIYSRSVAGKIKQIAFALYLESRYSKDQILEAYLNLAPYGGNIEGIGAAALVYFSKIPKELSFSESITLSVVPQNPNRRRLSSNNQNAAFELARKEIFQGLINSEERKLREINFVKLNLPFLAPHLVNRAISERYAEHKIQTSLDRSLQQGVERITSNYIAEKSAVGVNNISVLVVSNRDLMMRAYLGSADFFNTEIYGQVDLIQGRRSPGSALKPFIYALALDKGLIHPGTILKDAQFSRANYNPENFDKEFLGPIPATEALIRSRNSPAVSLLNDLGQEYFLDFLKKAGVGKLKDAAFYGLTLALGGEEVRMDELVSLYAGLANGGIFQRISLYPDKTVASGIKLLSNDAAFLTLEMLKGNPRPLQGIGNYDFKSYPIPWKTGTSFGFRDAWAAGIVGEYTLAVWIGNANSKGNPEFVGRELAGPIFFRLADYIIQEKGYREEYSLFRQKAKKVQVCAVSGDLPGPHCKLLKSSWFIPGTSSIHTCSVHREIEIEGGRRLCPGESHEWAEKKVFEFWPSDLMELFKRAGLPRVQPPAFPHTCNIGDDQGKAPLIGSPSPSVDYISGATEVQIPLSVVLDGASRKAFWFIDDSFFAEVSSGETKFWSPKPGEYLVRVVDDQGRANSILVKVRGGV